MNRQTVGISLIAGAALLMAVMVPATTLGTPGSEAVQVKGSPRLNIYFTKGFNDAAWQKAAFDKVAKSWIVAAPPAIGKKAVVMANIARDGKLIEAKLSQESGSTEWDKAAVEGVKKASPFPALPKSWVPTSLEVHFHFELSAQ